MRNLKLTPTPTSAPVKLEVTLDPAEVRALSAFFGALDGAKFRTIARNSSMVDLDGLTDTDLARICDSLGSIAGQLRSHIHAK